MYTMYFFACKALQLRGVHDTSIDCNATSGSMLMATGISGLLQQQSDENSSQVQYNTSHRQLHSSSVIYLLLTVSLSLNYAG